MDWWLGNIYIHVALLTQYEILVTAIVAQNWTNMSLTESPPSCLNVA